MKYSARKQVTVDVEIQVDDRIYNSDSVAFKVANVCIDGVLERLIDRDLYNPDGEVAERAALSINEAFAKADKILAITKDTPHD